MNFFSKTAIASSNQGYPRCFHDSEVSIFITGKRISRYWNAHHPLSTKRNNCPAPAENTVAVKCSCVLLLPKDTWARPFIPTQHHSQPLLQSEYTHKTFWLCLTQRTVPGLQACPEFAPDAWKIKFAPHSQGSFFPLHPAQHRQIPGCSVPAQSLFCARTRKFSSRRKAPHAPKGKERSCRALSVLVCAVNRLQEQRGC